jgi:hypothetical protein
MKEGARRRRGRGEESVGWLGCVDACWASYWSGGAALLGPFLRTRKWGGGGFVGKSGVGFFIFGWRGVARKWSWMRIGRGRGYEEESASTGGGVGADWWGSGWGDRIRGSGWWRRGRRSCSWGIVPEVRGILTHQALERDRTNPITFRLPLTQPPSWARVGRPFDPMAAWAAMRLLIAPPRVPGVAGRRKRP